MNRITLILLAVVVAGIVLSNTVGDGNALGAAMFLTWALALLTLVGLQVRRRLAKD